MGAPLQLTRRQVAQLKAASSGAAATESRVRVDRSGRLQAEFDLRENDVFLLVLKKR
jgi:xylan 1,4-beta-xylosidase